MCQEINFSQKHSTRAYVDRLVFQYDHEGTGVDQPQRVLVDLTLLHAFTNLRPFCPWKGRECSHPSFVSNIWRLHHHYIMHNHCIFVDAYLCITSGHLDDFLQLFLQHLWWVRVAIFVQSFNDVIFSLPRADNTSSPYPSLSLSLSLPPPPSFSSFPLFHSLLLRFLLTYKQ